VMCETQTGLAEEAVDAPCPPVRRLAAVACRDARVRIDEAFSPVPDSVSRCRVSGEAGRRKCRCRRVRISGSLAVGWSVDRSFYISGCILKLPERRCP
jgi:hypothetical protein